MSQKDSRVKSPSRFILKCVVKFDGSRMDVISMGAAFMVQEWTWDPWELLDCDKKTPPVVSYGGTLFPRM